MKISKEGIQLVYKIFDGMWLVFANENPNQYIAGIQKSLKFFEIKNDSIHCATQKNWYMDGIQAKTSHTKS